MFRFVGNDGVVSALERDLKSGNIAHAYLFVGTPGIGKFTLAKEFAGRIASDAADITVVRGDTIKKETIEGIVADSYIKPYSGRYKVYLIDGFEHVSVSGQNALLKTLEEPQAHVKIILTAGSTEGVLPVIVSRSRVIRFKDVGDAQIETFLRENLALGEANAKLFSRISAGSVRRALEYGENPGALEFRARCLRVIDRLLNLSNPFDEMAFFNEHKDQLEEFFSIYSLFLRDIIFNNLNVPDAIINIDAMAFIEKQHLSTEECLSRYQAIRKTRRYLRDNTNFELAIGGLLIGK
ncbi:DNA polymerase III subunit delta' [Peptoniphilus equinus]|uniref:DNA polymerase III subunit delta' n=1 Tax=Peptoniphilus equinus TaxID=3016343 RepID=A0ABY7QSJ6_9FIRM|nr:DNA polymerase III subunit delta' C-terminal domain-containing protein [Peptoniphilus equinus]WBW49757.1 DNA polymerase III subunit delta' [Peptoniphilus equinus]